MTFNNHTIFPFRLNHAENIGVKWLNDIDENHLSPLPFGFLNGQQTVRKRRLTVSVMVNADFVQDLETFFEEIGCSAFWLSDVPRDFSAVAVGDGGALNVSAGDLPDFLDEDLSYALIATPHGGTDPLFATVDDVQAEADGSHLIITTPALNVSSDTHEVSIALLVAVSGDRVTFAPETTDLWRMSVELVEVPFEVADALDNIALYYRYTFSAADHLGGSIEHKFSSEADNEDYPPIDITHSNLSYGLLSDENKCDISLQATAAGPFSGWTPFYLGPPLNLTIEEVEIVDDVETVTTIFTGECVKATRQGLLIEAEFEPRAFKGKVPNFFASPRDNVDQWRQHSVEQFRHETNVLASGANQLTIAWSDDIDPTILTAGHLVYVPEDGLAEVRDILAVTGVLGDTSIDIRISGPISAEDNDAIYCYQGYDGSPESYLALFGDISGFGGHPRITTRNPSFKAIELKTSSGKK